MSRLYAFLKTNQTVECIKNLTEEEYQEEVKKYQSGIDVEDISPRPEVGWVLNGNALQPLVESYVTPIGDFIIDWSTIKSFFNLNRSMCSMNYVDKLEYYYIWIDYRGKQMYLPSLVKGTADCLDFETNYKVQYCNVAEAIKSRITTCKAGRHLHDRYITFKTSNGEAGEDAYDNTDWLDRDYGDVSYVMKKIVDGQRVTTLLNSECDETYLYFEPVEISYEIAGGALFIPTTLPGDEDLYEIHAVCAPDVPAQYGGQICFIANPRIKWLKGNWLISDASLNPAELVYSATYHTSKILFVVKHPRASQIELQLNIRIFK